MCVHANNKSNNIFIYFLVDRDNVKKPQRSITSFLKLATTPGLYHIPYLSIT